MLNGDKRYLGDVLINEENYETQRQFFKDIIESYQWKFGGNFDASTLQDKTPDDFATKEQGEKAESAILSPLFLGKTEIRNLSDAQHIYSDAILIDRDNTGIDTIEWYKNLENDNITEALIDIYNQVMNIKDSIEANVDGKLDSNEYEDFINNDYAPLKDTLNNVFDVYTDENDNQVTKVNADLINGLRFILITQEAYDELPDKSKNYWRNIYIIKDAADIPPEYVDPMKWELEDGYTFAVNDGYLQINNGLSDEWKNVCTLNDLLLNADFPTAIQSYLENHNDYIIDSNALQNSISNISPITINDNWENYPFLTSLLRDDFVERILINNSEDNVLLSSNNGLKAVNLDIDTVINDKVNPIISNINSVMDTEKSKLTTAQNDIRYIQNQIDSIDVKNINQDGQISAINNKLNTISNQLTVLNNTVAQNIASLRSDIGNWRTINLGNYSHQHFYANEALRICWFCMQVNLTSNTSTWKKIPAIGVIPSEYRPSRDWYYVSHYAYGGKLNFRVAREDDPTYSGRFMYRCSSGASSSNPISIWFTGMYVY